MKLEDIRVNIDRIDSELINLLNERMMLSIEVGKNKIISGAPVLSADRENKILDKIDAVNSSFNLEIKAIMQSIMTMSREKQYQVILDSNIDWKLGADIVKARAKTLSSQNIAYSGKNGSYGEAAARKMYSKAKNIRGYKSFYDACQSVIDGTMDIAVLPLENTTAGTVNEVYDLIPANNLYIVKSMSDMISHCLLVVKGTKLDEIRTIISHPQALGQCSNIIKQKKWDIVECENTAYAAEEVANKGNKSIAAIGSIVSSEVYGLDVINININDEICNQTRFVAVARSLIVENNARKISIAFKLPHKAGALAWILYMFAGLSLNLTKIQSRPITNRPWEYIFYIDFLYNDEKKALQALYQLENELPELRLLGWYEEFNNMM